MIRWPLSAAALGTITGVALTVFGPNAALGVAVCALAVIVWFGAVAVLTDQRRMLRRRQEVWVRRMSEQYGPEYLALRNDVQDRLFDGIPELLADLKPWPIGDDEVRM